VKGIRILMENKIISLEQFAEIRKHIKNKGETIVLCHGVYDLVHYGHIEHLKEAHSQGDILVVSITASKYVNKGPGRPYFTDEQRLQFLASLEVVDYVILSEAVTVHKVVEYVQPDFYVKGQEYAVSEDDITANIDAEVECVRKYGGDVYFTSGQTYSSTKLMNNSFGVLPDKVLNVAKELNKKYSIGALREYVESFNDLKVLVIGDLIIDEYVFCKVQGLMSKDRAFSAKYKEEERYPGGSLAIARHLSKFSSSVTVSSMIGNESHIHTHILNEIRGEVFLDLCVEPKFKTIVKQRFLEKHPVREEYDKLFSINYLPTHDEIEAIDKEAFYKKLDAKLEQYDMVIVCDYGHGFIDQKTMKIIESKSKFLSVNCQTNSSNYGNNLITKYNRADSFVVDERELRLAFSAPYENIEVLLRKLKEHLKSKMGWVTIGADGAMGIDGEGHITVIPALTLNVTDTIGAGDAFYALASLSAARKMPVELGTLLGNIAGAMKVHTIGNSRPVDKVSALKFADTILNV
jgi:rfaE bifunctional protein nucleotidyltransferase chain/domain